MLALLRRAGISGRTVNFEVTWHDLVVAPDRLVAEPRRTLARLAARK